MHIKIHKSFSLLFIVMTIISVAQWCSIPLGNTYIKWTVGFSLLFLVLVYLKGTKQLIRKTHIVCILYLLWLMISVVRGVKVADNYWEYKNLVSGTLSLSFPLFTFYFASPIVLRQTLRTWNSIIPFVFILLFCFISRDSYHFLLTPVLLYGCFLNHIPKPWRYFVFAILVLMLVAYFGARAQMIKAMASLLCSVAFCFRKYIKNWFLGLVHWLLYFIPVILVALGIFGVFNVFEMLEMHEGKASATTVVDGQELEEDLASDTRTFIYVEVLSSAINNHYLWFGRTPARGNDSAAFGGIIAEELNTGKYERYQNEVCHANVFTWLGIIGLILHCLIYLQSSFLAVFRSNNRYMRFLGVMIAFNWLLGWIENTTGFNIMNFTIWIMISMGLSSCYREMSDSQFKKWFVSLFRIAKHVDKDALCSISDCSVVCR